MQDKHDANANKFTAIAYFDMGYCGTIRLFGDGVKTWYGAFENSDYKFYELEPYKRKGLTTHIPLSFDQLKRMTLLYGCDETFLGRFFSSMILPTRNPESS